MHNPMRIEFLHRTVPASEETIARRDSAVQRLGNLGHLDAEGGTVSTTATQWYARIGDTEMPVLDFSLECLDDGKVGVSLVAVVDTVSIGEPAAEPLSPPEGDTESDRQRLIVDRLEFAARSADRPSASSLGEQVAGNAAQIHGEASVRSRMQRFGLPHMGDDDTPAGVNA